MSGRPDESTIIMGWAIVEHIAEQMARLADEARPTDIREWAWDLRRAADSAPLLAALSAMDTEGQR